jgi:hypothetical protein
MKTRYFILIVVLELQHSKQVESYDLELYEELRRGGCQTFDQCCYLEVL